MIRDFTLADLITLGNGCAGMGACLLVLKYLLNNDSVTIWTAIVLLPTAGLLDYLDGRVARWRQRHSAFGAQLDSLSDLISFGVAPAILGFGLGLQGGWDAILLLYFVSCGISRLARYNVTAAEMSDATGKVAYFEGTPIPTSILLVGLWAVLLAIGRVGANVPLGSCWFGGMSLHPLTLCYALSGSAMISKNLRIPKP